MSQRVARRLTGSGSPRTIFPANTKPIATPSMTERTTRWQYNGRWLLWTRGLRAARRTTVPRWNDRGIEGTVVAEYDHRPSLTGTSFLLLAIKAIMQRHTIRMPTLKYDKTIQMPGFLRVPPFLTLTLYPFSIRWFRQARRSSTGNRSSSLTNLCLY